MKKIYFLLITLTAFNSSIAQWVPQNPNAPGADLKAVHFPTATTGYIACYSTNGNYSVLKTSNSGTTWVSLNLVGNYESVYFTSVTTGFVAGDNIMKTTNGGTSWTQVYSNTALFSIYFPNSTTGYAVGAMGRGFKTTDGGGTWQVMNIPTGNVDLYSVHFPNSTTGYAVGNNGMIEKTTNGGASWTELFQSFTTNPLYSVFFTSTTTGFCVSMDGYILKTTNGGTTWIQSLYKYGSFFQSIHFPTSNVGYAVGKGTLTQSPIFKTTDGGTTWINQDSKTTTWLRSVFFTDENTGHTVGDYSNGWWDNVMYTTSGGGYYVGTIEPDLTTKFKIFPNPATDIVIIEKIETSEKPYVIITNISGQELLHKRLLENKTLISLDWLENGIYFLKVIDNNTVEVRKLIKK